MSNNNWLERDPSQSPGLRRIQEAQQAVALAKAQEAQRVLAEQLAKEAVEKDLRKRESHREMIVGQRIDEISPLLREIRDFSNKTKTYPVSETYIKYEKCDSLELIEAAEVRISKVDPDGFGYIDVSYAHKGKGMRAVEDSDPDHAGYYNYVHFPAACFDGIRVRINGDTGSLDLLSEREVVIPAMKPIAAHEVGAGKSRSTVSGTPGRAEYIDKQPFWMPLSGDRQTMRQILAEAFHNPRPLDTQEIIPKLNIDQREDQASGSTLELVKEVVHFIFG